MTLIIQTNNQEKHELWETQKHYYNHTEQMENNKIMNSLKEN